MNVLAVEASGGALAMCALRVTEEHEIRARLQRNEMRAMSRELMDSLDETLSRADWKIGDVDVLCIGLGPGSWTSLRIVLSMMKTLAQTREISLAGIATFEAAAHAVLDNASGNDTSEKNTDSVTYFALLTIAPSRANEIYARLFWVESGALETLFAESVGTPQEIAVRVLASLHGRDASVLLCNLDNTPRNAPSEISEMLSQTVSVREVQVSPEAVAAQVARLGAEKIRDGSADNVLSLLPIYVAPSAAERLREKNLEAIASTRDSAGSAVEPARSATKQNAP